MMLKKFKIFICAILTMLCIFLTLSFTKAWTLNAEIEDTNIEGSSVGAYFASGNGSSDNPYIITKPRHFYNLAWLQDLGFFDEKMYYFELQDNIDMSSDSQYEIIPPIGIDSKGLGTRGNNTHPFIGHFNGNNYIVSNAIIATSGFKKYPDFVKASGGGFNTSFDFGTAMGLFGTVSGTDITDSSGVITRTGGVSNLLIDKIAISSTKDSINGLLCGYVDGNLSNVGIFQSKLTLGVINPVDTYSSSLSEYGIIGKVSDYINWEEKPGQVLDYVFDPAKIYDVTTSIGSEIKSFNTSFPNHTAYNRNVFDLIGELKYQKKSDFKNKKINKNDDDATITTDSSGNTVIDYVYENNHYTYNEQYIGYAIQFQNGVNSNGNARGDRCITFSTTGKGRIYASYAGNGSTKQITVFKKASNGTISLYKQMAETSAVQYELTWTYLDIDEAGDYIFAVDGGNAYLTHLHFIISNNQGSSSGQTTTGAISNIGYVSSLSLAQIISSFAFNITKSSDQQESTVWIKAVEETLYYYVSGSITVTLNTTNGIIKEESQYYTKWS